MDIFHIVGISPSNKHLFSIVSRRSIILGGKCWIIILEMPSGPTAVFFVGSRIIWFVSVRVCVYLCLCIRICAFVFVFDQDYLLFWFIFDENPFLRLRLALHEYLGVLAGLRKFLGNRTSETLSEGIPDHVFDSP